MLRLAPGQSWFVNQLWVQTGIYNVSNIVNLCNIGYLLLLLYVSASTLELAFVGSNSLPIHPYIKCVHEHCQCETLHAWNSQRCIVLLPEKALEIRCERCKPGRHYPLEGYLKMERWLRNSKANLMWQIHALNLLHTETLVLYYL